MTAMDNAARTALGTGLIAVAFVVEAGHMVDDDLRILHGDGLGRAELHALGAVDTANGTDVHDGLALVLR